MLIGILFTINLLAVGIVFFLRWRGWRTAYLWLILVFISLLDWFLLILIRVENFHPLVLDKWFSIGTTPIVLQFQITNQNWPVIFSILSVLPAFLLTGIARLDVRRDLRLWSSAIVVVMISFLAVTVSNLWTLLILWTAFDLFDVFFHLVILQSTERAELQRSLIVRFIGSLFLIYQTASLSQTAINPSLDSLSGSGSIIFIIAAFLHSGVLPIQRSEQIKTVPNSGRIIEGMLRLLIFVVSLSLLIYLPVPNLNFLFSLSISILLFVLLVRLGFSAVVNKEEFITGKSVFFMSVFLVFIFFQDGNPEFWLPALFMTGTFALFYSHRNPATVIFPLLMAVVVSGLPYSLDSFGGRGFLNDASLLSVIFSIIPLILYLSGFVRKSMAERNDFNSLESIYQLVFLSGLMIMILSGELIAFKFINGSRVELSLWWAGVIVVLFTSVLVFLTRQEIRVFPLKTRLNNSSIEMRILSLNWLFDLGQGLKNRLRNFVSGFSRLLEGSGGLLWALVFLVLILSILR